MNSGLNDRQNKFIKLLIEGTDDVLMTYRAIYQTIKVLNFDTTVHHLLQ